MTIDRIRIQKQARRDRLEQIIMLTTLWAGSVYIAAHVLAASWR